MSRHKYRRLGLSTVTTLLIILVVVGIIGTYSLAYYKSNFRFFKEDVATLFATITDNRKESLNIENLVYRNSTQSLNVTLTNTGLIPITIQNVTLSNLTNTVIKTNQTVIAGSGGSISSPLYVKGSLCGILPGASCTVSVGYHCVTDPLSLSITSTRGNTWAAKYAPINPWFNSNWQYRKAITINTAKVAGQLNNFTALINMTDGDLKNNAWGDGQDIVFTACDGKTLLNSDIENYTASTGSLVAWVRMPVIYNTPNNVIYMYYGNTGGCPAQSPVGTWDPKYAAVYHLKENPNASTSPVQLDNVQSVATATDSSSNAYMQNFAVGSGLYRVLVVGVTGDQVNATNVTYGSQPLSMVTTASVHNSITGSIWYLLNPTCNAATISVKSSAASKNMVIGAYSISGADQTAPIPNYKTATGNIGNPSVIITNGQTGSIVLDLAGIANSGGLNTPTQTKEWSVTDSTITSGSSKAGPLLAATPTTFTWTPNPSTNWVEIAIEVRAPYVPALSLAGTVSTASSDNSIEAWKSLTLPNVVVVNNINRLLLVAVTADDGNVTSVTYGGKLINHIKDVGAGTADVAIWDMVNPPIGTANIVATAPGNGGPLGIGAYSLYGVDTTNPIPTFVTTTGDCSTPPPDNPCTTITLTNKFKYGWAIDIAGLNAQPSTSVLQSSTQTQQWSMTLPDLFSTGEIASASSKNTNPLTAVGTNTIFSWNNGTDGGGPWAAVAVEIKNSTSLIIPPLIYDSTSHANNLSPNSMLASDQIKGQIGGSLNYRGSNYLSNTLFPVGMPATNAAQTGSFWYKVSSNPSTTQDIYSMQQGVTASVQAGFRASNLAVWRNDGTLLVATSPPPANIWHYVAYTYDPSLPSQKAKLYIDAIKQNYTSHTPDSASPDSFYMGAISGGLQPYTGLVDELRISTIARSATLIATEYNNQVSPSTFYTVGPPQSITTTRSSN